MTQIVARDLIHNEILQKSNPSSTSFILKNKERKYWVDLKFLSKCIYSKINKLVSAFRQVSGFLRVFQFPPPIKLTTMI